MSTITLFKLQENILGKNYAFGAWYSYLTEVVSSSNKYVETGFQYVRPELDITIKINMSQDYVPYKFPYNYLMLQQYDEYETEIRYFYLITGVKQLAMSTLELKLHMDVLNTYSMGTAVNPTTYKLKKSTFVLREHKDRFVKPTYQKSIRNISFSIGANATKNLTMSIPETIDTGVSASDITISYSNDNLQVVVTGVSNGVVEYSVTNTSSSALLLIVNIDVSINFGSKVLKKIDKYPEGINVTLFKQEEYDLRENDEEFYILFQNENDVTQNPHDTQADYVNPVKLMLISNEEKYISTTNAVTKRVYCSDLPNFVSKQEVLKIIHDDYDGTDPVIVIGGTTYTLKAPWQTSYGTNEYDMIIFRRAGASDTHFAQIKAYRHIKSANNETSVTTTNIGSANQHDSFEITHVNYGHILAYSIWSDSIVIPYNNSGLDYPINSGAVTISEVLNTFSSLDLTDPKNIKLFNIPYSPEAWFIGNEIESIPTNYIVNNTMKMLEVKKINNASFNRQIAFTSVESPVYKLWTSITPAYAQTRSMEYETKLLHSDFYLPKLVYDSFTFQFQLENMDLDEWLKLPYKEDFVIDYAVTTAVASRFMFSFPQYQCGKYQTQDYNNILIVDRNNEVQLFSNAYMEYMKLGYQFDTKSIQRQQTANLITTTLSIIGAVASFASSVYTGGAGVVGGVSLMTTAIGSTTRAITQAQQQDASMSQKLLQLNNQSESVSGNSDLDLLRYYTNLRPKLVYYGVSEVMKEALYNLFFYCGYATREYKVPNTFTRKYFNFVQAEIVYEKYHFTEDIAKEIQQKWKEGITFFHPTPDDTYDFAQQYENWETNL